MNLLSWFRNLKISSKLRWLSITGVIALVFMLTLILFNVKMLSALRGAVGAQGIWEKHQKQAHISLLQFAYEGKQADYDEFLKVMSVVQVYEELRQEILNKVPDHDYATALLIKGGCRKEDIPGMLFLFKHFQDVSYISSAMQYWGGTAPLFEKQIVLVDTIKNVYERVPLDKAAIENLLPMINELNADLTSLGGKFSEVLGEGSRWLESLVFTGILFLMLFIGASMIFVFHRISVQINHWIRQLIKATQQLATGNLNYRIHVDEQHELAQLSDEFNQMTDSISDLIAKNKLIESHLRDLSLVASETDNAIYICDANGRVEWVNDAFEKLSGYPTKQIIGTHVEVVSKDGLITGLHPDSEPFKEMLRTRGSVRYESQNYSSEGVEYWVFTTLSPIYNEKGILVKVIAIDVDVTKMKHAERELSKAKDRAEASEQAKQRFLANMSHEIRTPMNAIIGFTDLLQDSTLNPSQKESVEAIKSSGEHLLVLVNEILDLAKIEAGRLELEFLKFNLKNLMSSAVNLFQPKARLKNLKCELDYSESLPETFMGDPYRLNQILTNLLSNAIKFTKEGFVKLKVSGEQTEGRSWLLNVKVEDTGIGVSEDRLDEIFESFTQATDGITREYGGTGLGLTIVIQLLNKMGGKMDVKSTIGEGTVFSFSLSLEKADSSNAVKLESIESQVNKKLVASDLKGVSILVVEDNPVNQLLTTRVLTAFGSQVEIAENGRVAVEKVAEKKYGLILMDLQMPEKDGFQASREIRNGESLNKQTPIIAMTAHILYGEKEKCFANGMNDYISKPFDALELREKLLLYVSEKKEI